MEKYLIQGGGKLKGEIKVAGAKNHALKVLAACVMMDGECVIRNMPRIEDIFRMIEVMEGLGAKASWEGSTLTIDCSSISGSEPDFDLARKFRASMMLAGPLLARFGKVSMPHPGGCIIGKRPIDLFMEGFRVMGAKIHENENEFEIKAPKLTGGRIVMTKVAVTATESLMMTACLAKGTTVIVNAAMEPEIPALADFLNSCGARISGAGTSEITIEGVAKLNPGECEIIPDRIDAGSFIMMGLITGSEIKFSDCNPKHLEVVLATLEKAGAKMEIGENYVVTKPSKLRGTELRTHEYPGFNTDQHAIVTVLITQAEGVSLIHETIFDGRLFYTDKLTQMGANIVMCDPYRVIVNGPTQLYGRTLESPDLRAGMALVLAGLIANGRTTIENIYQIERGYENIIERLRSLGADISKTTD